MAMALPEGENIIDGLLSHGLHHLVQQLFLWMDFGSLRSAKMVCKKWRNFVQDWIWSTAVGRAALKSKLERNWMEGRPSRAHREMQCPNDQRMTEFKLGVVRCWMDDRHIFFIHFTCAHLVVAGVPSRTTLRVFDLCDDLREVFRRWTQRRHENFFFSKTHFVFPSRNIQLFNVYSRSDLRLVMAVPFCKVLAITSKFALFQDAEAGDHFLKVYELNDGPAGGGPVEEIATESWRLDLLSQHSRVYYDEGDEDHAFILQEDNSFKVLDLANRGTVNAATLSYESPLPEEERSRGSFTYFRPYLFNLSVLETFRENFYTKIETSEASQSTTWTKLNLVDRVAHLEIGLHFALTHDDHLIYLIKNRELEAFFVVFDLVRNVRVRKLAVDAYMDVDLIGGKNDVVVRLGGYIWSLRRLLDPDTSDEDCRTKHRRLLRLSLNPTMKLIMNRSALLHYPLFSTKRQRGDLESIRKFEVLTFCDSLDPDKVEEQQRRQLDPLDETPNLDVNDEERALETVERNMHGDELSRDELLRQLDNLLGIPPEDEYGHDHVVDR